MNSNQFITNLQQLIDMQKFRQIMKNSNIFKYMLLSSYRLVYVHSK